MPMAGGRDLTSDHDEWRGVHVRVADRRHDVRRPRTAGDHRDARLAGREGVALGHVAGALLVTHEDVADRGVEDRVVDGENRATGQPEDGVDPFAFQALDQCLRSCELHNAPLSPISKKASLFWEASGVRGRVTTGARRLLLPESRLTGLTIQSTHVNEGHTRGRYASTDHVEPSSTSKASF